MPARRGPAPHQKVPNPQAGAVAAIIGSLQGSLREDPGLRLGHTTSRGARTATRPMDGVQRFIRPARPNSEETLTAPISVNQRRALNRMRGLGMR